MPSSGRDFLPRYLDIGGNPALGGSIPAQYSTLNRLQQLLLLSTNVTGSIPPEISALTSLTYGHCLLVTVARGEGTACAQAGHFVGRDCADLPGRSDCELPSRSLCRYLNVDNCYISGALPSTIGAMPQLQFLHAVGNQLSGSLPDSLSLLTNLDHLAVGGNRSVCMMSIA